MKNTKGIWKIEQPREDIAYRRLYADQIVIAYIELFGPNPREYEANAKLIAEAGTVANETGFTPRQLADQKAKLLEALNTVYDMIDEIAIENGTKRQFDLLKLARLNIEQAIKNAEG